MEEFMNIIEARVEDAEDIYNLYYEVMKYDYPVEKMKKMISLVSMDKNNYVFVAIDHDCVVGVVEVVIKYSIHKEPYLIINTFAVLTKYQGKGIGSQLLVYVEDFAKKQKLASITLGSQFKRVEAHEFYKKNGFKIIKEHKIFKKNISYGEDNKK
jgi:GNAT superfamily N-acetyltransferase